jgi:hypothetical protein
MRQRFTHKVLIWLGVFLCVFLSSVPNKSVAATIADFKVPEDFRFTRDISFGTTARPDVSYVQNILNMSTSTRVAISGAGSLKTPSNYYGIKTRDALARFQSIFAVDIEYEKSISTSTATSTTAVSSSTLDVFTRSVLNKLIIIYSGDRERYQEYVRTGTTTPTKEEVVPEEVPPPEPAPSSSGFNNNTNNSNNSSSNGIKPPHQVIYEGKKFLFTYSPQGQILKAIGGQQLVDKVFSYTPAGQIGQLTGSGSSGSGGAALGIAGVAGLGALGLGGGAAAEKTVAPLNFGGVSTAMVTCTCSSNLLIYVQDVRGPLLPLIYQPGVTILYRWYQPRSGVNMLGNYVGGGTCLVYAVTGCVTGGTPVGTMTQLGTSMTIAPGL